MKDKLKKTHPNFNNIPNGVIVREGVIVLEIKLCFKRCC